MAEQFDTKPLLKILKNILKYGMKNKKDSKQLLETVSCVLNFGLDNMMKEFSEKKYNDNELKYRPMSFDLTKNESYDNDVEKEDTYSINDILLKQNVMQKLIETNKNTLDTFMNKVLEKLEKLSDRISKIENVRSKNEFDLKDEKPKENITLEILEKETNEESGEIKASSVVIKDSNKIVSTEDSSDSEEEEVEEE